jgi:8-oxo-dGTP pyrophosphatase MutT (NUDIX family)
MKAEKRGAPLGKRRAKPGPAIRVQYGALPYRFTKAGALELLLVTSRRSRRWIIPKGWPIKGLKPAKSAAREAYEEAGIRGAISGKSIGAFCYDKNLEESGLIVPCEVRVFSLIVKRQLITWPEAHQRESRWFEPTGALAAVNDAALGDLIASFVEKMRAAPCA